MVSGKLAVCYLKKKKHFLDNNSDSITCYVGTKIYSAPETEKAHYKYNQKADIYSLGRLHSNFSWLL